MKDETNDELILFLAVIAQSFTDSKHEPIILSLADFEPLPFKKVNEFIDQFTGSKTFIVLSRPKSAQDKTPYKLEQTEYQKTEFAKTRAEMEHLRDLQMLMIYFGRICMIYDAISGGYVGFDDGQVNRMYLLLSIRLEKILAKDEFTELREAKPELYDTLMGSYEDLDMAYEFMRPEIWGYYGKLERIWLEKADERGSFELKDDEKKLLDDTDEAIKQHSERKSRLNANFEKRLEQDAPKIREQMEGNLNPNKPKSENQELSIHYDKTSKTLLVNDLRLKMRGDMQANLCEVVLLNKDKAKQWSNDEVFEAWGWSEDMIFDDEFKVKKQNRLKIYQKAKDLNDKIALKTKGTVSDLFDTTTKSVCIAERYRKNVS